MRAPTMQPRSSPRTPTPRARMQPAGRAPPALLMTAAVGGAAHLLDDHLTAGSGHGLAVLAALIALAMAVYFGACTALGAASPADLKHALARPKPRA